MYIPIEILSWISVILFVLLIIYLGATLTKLKGEISGFRYFSITYGFLFFFSLYYACLVKLNII
jgi:hypothetical protein